MSVNNQSLDLHI